MKNIIIAGKFLAWSAVLLLPAGFALQHVAGSMTLAPPALVQPAPLPDADSPAFNALRHRCEAAFMGQETSLAPECTALFEADRARAEAEMAEGRREALRLLCEGFASLCGKAPQ